MTTNHHSNDSSKQVQVPEGENKRLCSKLSADKKAMRRYQVKLSSFEEWYYEFNLKGNITYFSPSICKASGYSEKELLYKNYRDFTSSEMAKKLFQIFNKIYLTGKPTEFFEYEVFAKTGKAIYVEASVYLIRGSNGNPIGFQGFARDITDQKK
jgi:PAS domain S-box-containing protein